MVDQVTGGSVFSAQAKTRRSLESFFSWLAASGPKTAVAANAPRTLKRTGLTILLSPVLLLAGWFALSHSGLFPTEVVVPPEEVAATFWDMVRSGDLQRNLSSSLGRLAIGYGIGAGIGLLLGSFMGLSRNAEAYLHPTFQLIRQLPTIALIPAFIMVLGIGETVKIVLVAKATALPVALAAFEGVKGIPRVYLDVADIYKIRPLTRFFRVILPATVPPVLSGMRIALSRSWMVLVGTELLIADSGIGQMMEWGRQVFRIDLVLVGVVITGVIGFTLDKSFRLLERRLVRWRYR
jgi:sulfonate transport system permease protein